MGVRNLRNLNDCGGFFVQFVQRGVESIGVHFRVVTGLFCAAINCITVCTNC